MEPHTFAASLAGLSQLPGLALVLCVFALLWYSTFYSQRKAHSENSQGLRETYQSVLDQYKNDVNKLSTEHNQAAKEMRLMYDNNIRLVEQVITLNERYEKRGESLERLIQTNIQCWQTAIQSMNDNQYCPRVRELGGKT
jgi:YD repeat-containing protein